MKKYFKYIVLVFLIGCGIIHNSSCSKKPQWTTSSQTALDAFLEGRDFQNAFNRDKAIKCYYRAFDADTNFAIAALSLAEITYSNGQIDSAKYFLKKSMKLADKASRFEKLIIRRAYSRFRMNSDEAKSIEDTLLTEYADRFDVKVIKAQILFNNGDNKESRDIYIDLIKDHPDYAMGYNMIAYTYLLQGYFRDAYDYFRKYLEIAPNILNPYDSMAEFYMITGKYHEAIKTLETVINEKPDLMKENSFLSAVIYLKIADGYRNLGQYNKAIEYAEVAKTIHRPTPSYHQINHFRFFLYQDLDEVDNMQREYDYFKDRVSKFQSTYFGILLDIAQVNYSSAEKRINEFCSKNQNKDKYYIRFLSILEGELAFGQERYAVAADKFKTAYTIKVDMHPEKIENKYYICLGLDGNYATAIKGFLNILNKNPNEPTALYYISKFYYESDNLPKAKNYLNHFLTLWADADENVPLLIKAKELQEILNRSE